MPIIDLQSSRLSITQEPRVIPSLDSDFIEINA